LCRPQATAAAIGACQPAHGLRESDWWPALALGWVGFLAAAGGCGIGFWMARQPARRCGGCGRLGDRGGGRSVARFSRSLC